MSLYKSIDIIEKFIQDTIQVSTNPLINLINKTKYTLSLESKLDSSILDTLDSLITRSESTAKIAVIGQFSSGKSTFLNALLGEEILPSGITPLTAKVCEISYGLQKELSVYFKDGKIRIMPLGFLNEVDEILNTKIDFFKITLPLDLLKNLTFLDTPGFNSNRENDTKVTNEILDSVDGIIWLSLIDNVGKNSEIEILQTHLKKYAQKSICILNQKDRLKNENEIKTSLEYAKNAFNGLFSHIIPISSRMALNKQADSGIDYILDIIDKEFIPNAKKLKEFSVKRELKNIIINELFKTHKNKSRLKNLISILNMQSATIKFNATQTTLLKNFESLFYKFDSLIENLSVEIFNELQFKELEFVNFSKNQIGINKKIVKTKKVMLLPKEVLLSKLSNNENPVIIEFRKLGFLIKEFSKEFNKFLDSNLEEFQEVLSQWKSSVFFGFQTKSVLANSDLVSIYKDYELSLLESKKMLQNELDLLCNLLVLNYNNAIYLALERLDSKIQFALLKHRENENFALFNPVLSNVRDLLNESFYFTIFQDKLLLTNSLYKKSFLHIDSMLDNVNKKHQQILESKIHHADNLSIKFKEMLQKVRE